MNTFLLLMFFFSLAAIQNRNPVWYQALTQGLNEEQRKQLQDIATLADQRRAAHGIFFPLYTINSCFCCLNAFYVLKKHNTEKAYNSSLIMSSSKQSWFTLQRCLKSLKIVRSQSLNAQIVWHTTGVRNDRNVLMK